jgi:archaellum component FlaC
MYVEFSPATETASLTKSKDVFKMVNTVSDNFNTFQTKYARYLRCQNKDTSENVTPPCALSSDDNLTSLTDAYIELFESLDDVEKVYDSQSIKDGKTTEDYKKHMEEIDINYNAVNNMRKDLDDKLRYIQENKDTRIGPAYKKLNSRILINTILVIVLFYLIYIFIFDLLVK